MYGPMNANPRKRPAPGASSSMAMAPMQQQQQQQQPPQQQQHSQAQSQSQQPRLQNPVFMNNADMSVWPDGTDAAFLSGNPQAANPYSMMPTPQPQHQQLQPQYGQAPAPNPNNALARRSGNRALVPTAPRATMDNDSWNFINDTSLLPHQSSVAPTQQPNGAVAEQDSLEALKVAAQKAKREAQAKRKQIPPFVQKLSSFLDEEKNVELIRWSENGDSFIVIDEDEFAKTLIPELFKHNNYASFVRQLNMYGFHKRVGLSDNSMRASERKNKSPSEYSNPYFRRGHPDLLWLINKPKGGGKKPTKAEAKQAHEGEGESDDEAPIDETPVPERVGFPSGQPQQRALPAAEMPLDRKDMTLVKEELAKLRAQQKTILDALSRLQQNNNGLYQQAAIFQEQHERHQSSINAILNFLANVFRKTIEDQSGQQNVNDLLANIIPGSSGGNVGGLHQGSVVDLGDFVQSQTSGSNVMGGHKKARGLLPPIPGPNAGRASTVGSTPSASGTPQPAHPSYHGHHNLKPGTVTEVFDSPENNPSPDNSLAQDLKSKPHESMMKIIQDTNANNNNSNAAAGMDLPDAVANAPSNMTETQRQQLLDNMMAASSAPTSASIPSAAGGSMAASSVETDGVPVGNNLSLSPLVGSNPQPPNVDQVHQSQSQLEELRRMSDSNSETINHLQNMLGPLSPSGRIPEYDGSGLPNSYLDANNFDIEPFLNEGAFESNGAADLGDVDFDFSGLDNEADVDSFANPGHAPAGVGARDTPSPTGTEEIQRDGFEMGEGSPRGSKRRRVS